MLLRYNKKTNKFYFLVGIIDGPDSEYALLNVADTPAGPWKIFRLGQRLYDPGLIFEDDGTCYAIHGQTQLYITRLKLVDEETGEYQIDETFTEPDENGCYNKPFYKYEGGYYNEGTRPYKIDGVYYIIGTPTWDWEDTQTKKEICIQTKDLLNGPYEVRDILSSYMKFEKIGVHQGGIVDVPLEDGTSQWWSIIFQGRYKLGRTPTLQPVYWETDEKGLKWPILGEKGKNGEQASITHQKPMIKSDVAHDSTEFIHYFDDFETDELDLCWQWNHVPNDTKWGLTERPGFMRLHTATVTEDVSRAQNTLRQRVLGPESSATIKLDISHMADGDIAGLIVHQKEFNYIGVKYDAMSNTKTLVINDNGIEQITMSMPADTVDMWLRAKTPLMEYRTEFFYSFDGVNFVRLGGRYDMHYGTYVGMGFGVFNFATKKLGGYVDLDSFSIDTYRRNSNYCPLGSKIEAEHYDNQKYEIAQQPSRHYNPLTTWTSDYVYTSVLTKWGDAFDLAVSNLRDGDWIQYNQVELGDGAEWFNARVSGIADGGIIEVHLNSVDGRLLSVINVPNTGNDEVFKNVFAKMDNGVTGIRKIFLVYHGPENICRINWFMFGVGVQPIIPNIPKADARAVGISRAEISWESAENAIEYDIKIVTEESNKIISNVISPFCETGLDRGKIYEVSVRSKNYAGYSEWSKPVELKVGLNNN